MYISGTWEGDTYKRAVDGVEDCDMEFGPERKMKTMLVLMGYMSGEARHIIEKSIIETRKKSQVISPAICYSVL